MIRVPENIQGLIDSYVKFRREPGGFVRAVLENDLAMAVGRADHTSYAHLREIVSYVHWEVPSGCHGSPEKVQKWLDRGRGEAT